MFGFNRLAVAEHERVLMFVNRRYECMLEPGVHRLFDPLNRVRLHTLDMTRVRIDVAELDRLLLQAPAFFASHTDVVDLTDQEAALVYHEGRLFDVLAPGSHAVYWATPLVNVAIERFSVEEPQPVDARVMKAMTRTESDHLRHGLSRYIYATTVDDNAVGMLVVNGELREVLAPGQHAYWTFHDTVRVEVVDQRAQLLELNGQELLTKDKVTLRVSVLASYRVVDPVAARQQLTDFSQSLYRELQFALRAAVGTRSLDALLGDKAVLDRTIDEHVRERVAAHGIEVVGVGVRDIILPGDMKEILNQVVAAEKAAQANVIRRREETAATRSLLNTARLMDENPTLRRLKELEVLEKVTEKVDRLTVFGGLDGVLSDTVRIDVEG
ncbi:MAG: slipin family protein [Pseudomonadota bacterium]